MRDIVVVAHNIRSAHNVGAIFRTCEGFGVTELILSGYTPYPTLPHDERLPHLSRKLTSQIQKTALGAVETQQFSRYEIPPIEEMKSTGYRIVGLEQTTTSLSLATYNPPEKCALILGEEVTGIPEALLARCDETVEIPMNGKKESFNVSVANGIALYALFYNP